MGKKQRRTDVAYEEVVEAAERLQKEGGRVSTKRVLDSVGGSWSTIGPFMDRWKAENRKSTVVARDLPDTVRDAAMDFIHGLWEKLDTEFQNRVAMVRTEADDRVADIEANLSEYIDAVVTVESERDQILDEVYEAKAEVEKLTQQLSEVQQVNANLTTAVELHEREIDRLRVEEKSLQGELDVVRAEVIEAKTGKSVAEKRVSEVESWAKEELEKAEKREVTIQQQAEQREAKIQQQAEQRVTDLRAEADAESRKAAEKCEELEQRLAGVTQERDMSREELSANRVRLELLEQNASLQKQVADLVSFVDRQGGIESSQGKGDST